MQNPPNQIPQTQSEDDRIFLSPRMTNEKREPREHMDSSQMDSYGSAIRMHHSVNTVGDEARETYNGVKVGISSDTADSAYDHFDPIDDDHEPFPLYNFRPLQNCDDEDIHIDEQVARMGAPTASRRGEAGAHTHSGVLEGIAGMAEATKDLIKIPGSPTPCPTTTGGSSSLRERSATKYQMSATARTHSKTNPMPPLPHGKKTKNLTPSAKNTPPSAPYDPSAPAPAYPYGHYPAHVPYYYPYYPPHPSTTYHWPYPPPHAYPHYYPPPPAYYGPGQTPTSQTSSAPSSPAKSSSASNCLHTQNEHISTTKNSAFTTKSRTAPTTNTFAVSEAKPVLKKKKKTDPIKPQKKHAMAPPSLSTSTRILESLPSDLTSPTTHGAGSSTGSLGEDSGGGNNVERRVRKNAQSRLRAAKLKRTIEYIRTKRSNERTPEETAKIAVYEERRLRKNERSRERALERKNEFERITSKPESVWTDDERKFMGDTMVAKYKKNEGDRMRRKRMKEHDKPDPSDHVVTYDCRKKARREGKSGPPSMPSIGGHPVKLSHTGPNRSMNVHEHAVASHHAHSHVHGYGYSQHALPHPGHLHPHGPNQEHGQSHPHSNRVCRTPAFDSADASLPQHTAPLTPVPRVSNEHKANDNGRSSSPELPSNIFAMSPGAGLAAAVELDDDKNDPMSHFVFPSPIPDRHEQYYSPTLELSAGASILDQSLEEIAYSPRVIAPNGHGHGHVVSRSNHQESLPRCSSPINLSPLVLPRRSRPADEGSFYDAFASDLNADDMFGGRQDAIAVSFSVDTI